MPRSIFTVAKMDCASEEQLIRARLATLPGVTALAFNLLERELTVTHTTNENAVLAALAPLQLDARVKVTAEGSENTTPPSAPAVSRLQWFALAVSGAAALSAEALGWLSNNEQSTAVVLLALLSILAGGRETLKKGWLALRTFTLNIHFLMSLAVAGAAALGEWPEAAVMIFLFALAELIETLSLDRARRAIGLLMQMAPDTALIQLPSGEWQEVDAKDVNVDQVIRVRPGERVALDGVVVNGESRVNQAPITGESMPVAKRRDDIVFAGTINESGALDVRVTAAKGNTTLDRVIRAVRQAQAARAPTQRWVDQFARYYTPGVVILAVLVATVPPLVWATPFIPWVYKALVLLVIACPCALVISTPVTVVSGLAAAARSGILVKGGAFLEQGHRLRAIAFDKTGTLTEGCPVVTDVVSLDSIDAPAALRLAAALDAHSKHPVARAIVTAWQERSDVHAPLPAVDAFETVNGLGVRGTIAGTCYLIGNHRWMEELGLCSLRVEHLIEPLERVGKTVAILSSTSGALAVFAVADTLRESSIEAISALHQRGTRTIMLTGDNPLTARAIASQAGIDDVRAGLLPNEKLAAIDELTRLHSTVGMVGDGINDAPALAQASIGFAMGAAGSDVAIETADVALMVDDLRKVPQFLRLSEVTAHVLWQNIALALGIKLIFFGLALSGFATLWMAVFADMGASLLVVFNGLRLLGHAKPAHENRTLARVIATSRR